MSDINHVVLVGRLTRDAELKYTNTGIPVSKLGIAVNRKRKKDDAWINEVNFFNVTIMGKIAESLQQYLSQGKQIGVEGELRQNRWEKDGQAHSTVEIFASNIQLLSSKNDNRASNAPMQNNFNGENKQAENSVDDFEDDSIPF